MNHPVKVAVVGANGYSGEELCAILARHPGAELCLVTSRQHAGKPVTEVMPRFAGWPGLEGLRFQEPSMENLLGNPAEVFFLALPHGLAKDFAGPLLAAGKRVIDISADFRLRDAAIYEEFYQEKHPAPELLIRAVYGLADWKPDAIRGAQLVASPGCYPTSMLLPLLPLVEAGVIAAQDIAVSSVSGVSGAGRKADASLLFAECNESVRAYGLPKHRHLSEVEQELSLAANEAVVISFSPHLVPMNRGIHTTIYARLKDGQTPEAVDQAWAEKYGAAAFVRCGTQLPDTKNVSGTNFCDIAWRYDSRAGRLILLSAIDNLVKGAGGQAVQSFNLIFGFPETTGLL